MKREQPLKRQFRVLVEYVQPTHDFLSRVMKSVQQEAEEAEAALCKGRMRRWIALQLPRYAAGLGMVACLILAIVLWLKPGVGTNIAFADVQEAIREIRTAVVVCHFPERPFWNCRLYYRRDSDLSVYMWSNGVVHVLDGHGKVLLLNTRDKVARYEGIAPPESISTEYLDQLANIEEHSVGRLGERVIDGRKLVGFVLKPQKPQEIVGLARTEVWVDPTTRLPVREDFRPTDPNDIVTSIWRSTYFYTFNVPVDQSLFRMTPPDGYTVLKGAGLHPLIARPHAELPDDPELAAPTVEFLYGIGPAKFGMGIHEILDVLGRPDEMTYTPKYSRENLKRMSDEFDRLYREVARRVNAENLDALQEQMLRSKMQQELIAKYKPQGVGDTINIDYQARGFMLVCDKNDGLFAVFCMSPESSLYGGFRGATSKGIGIGSSVEEIENAYGPADLKKLDANGSGSLVYVSLAALFDIEDGRLRSFSFNKDAKSGGYDKIKLNENK